MIFRKLLGNKKVPRKLSSIAEFNNAPLDEVVLGVQFVTPPNLRSVHFGRFHERVKVELPDVEDQAKLLPLFETFGGNAQNGPTFQFGQGASLDRVWFVSGDGNHLLQFQEDRLLLNWRRRVVGDVYPRYEAIIASYEAYLEKLSNFLKDELAFPLSITQAEISYINFQRIKNPAAISEWVGIVNLSSLQPETFNIILSEVLSHDGKPHTRMHYLIQSAIMNDEMRSPGFRFELTCRGAPNGDGIDATMEFLDSSREAIVKKFLEITTPSAQEAWGRVK